MRAPWRRSSTASSASGCCPHADGVGRVAATEVAVNTGLVAEAIVDPSRTATIPDAGRAGRVPRDAHLPPGPGSSPRRGDHHVAGRPSRRDRPARPRGRGASGRPVRAVRCPGERRAALTAPDLTAAELRTTGAAAPARELRETGRPAPEQGPACAASPRGAGNAADGRRSSDPVSLAQGLLRRGRAASRVRASSLPPGTLRAVESRTDVEVLRSAAPGGSGRPSRTRTSELGSGRRSWPTPPTSRG